MRIVEPYARIAGEVDGIALLKKIEWCGRISHRSEDDQKADTWERFIRAVVLQHGDWSIVEHASVTVDMLVDRGITHEIVRHRLFSFTQESTRFVNYNKPGHEAVFVMPDFSAVAYRAEAEGNWTRGIEKVERAYQDLVSGGCAPQIARSVFPNALGSRILITGNLRNWRHFLIMRTTKEAHPQMRQVTIPLLAEFQERIPILFEDIIPNSRQIDNLRLPR
jgi:thymidylate synthase (FAD)